MKILLVGFHEPETMSWYMDKNLEKLGHEPDTFCYRKIFQHIPAESLVSTGFRHFPVLRNVYIRKMNHDLREHIKGKVYDLGIVFKGESINQKTINHLKKSCNHLVNWFMDPVVTLSWGSIFDSIRLYDKFLVKDMFIKQRLEALGFENVELLMEAYDPETYRKVQLSEEDADKYSADIAHVGNIYPYRLKNLEQLKGYNLRSWGKLTEGISRNQVDWFYQGRKAIGEEKNKIFNASKISLNTHNPWEIAGVNVRTFEICGSGAFQLTNKTMYMENVFEMGKEVACYENIREMKETVDYYLENEAERKKIAEKGYLRARKDHTYEKRIEELFRLL